MISVLQKSFEIVTWNFEKFKKFVFEVFSFNSFTKTLVYAWVLLKTIDSTSQICDNVTILQYDTSFFL